LIDWIVLRLPRVRAFDLPSSELQRVDPDGVVTTLRYMGTQVPSYETSIRIRPIDSQIEISGNPSKFLQGHNLTGKPDVLSTLRCMLRKLSKILGQRYWPEHPFAYAQIHEIHLSQLVDMETASAKSNFLIQLGLLSSTRHKRQSVFQGETVYLGRSFSSAGKRGKTSKYYYWRFYDKEKELLSHRQHSILSSTDISACVRAELVLKRAEIVRLGLESPKSWDKGQKMSEEIYLQYLDHIKVATGNALAAPTPPVGMIAKDQGIWMRWYAGHDLRVGTSKASYYRLRTKFLGEYGIDINLPPYLTENNVLDFGWFRLRDRSAWMTYASLWGGRRADHTIRKVA